MNREDLNSRESMVDRMHGSHNEQGGPEQQVEHGGQGAWESQ